MLQQRMELARKANELRVEVIRRYDESHLRDKLEYCKNHDDISRIARDMLDLLCLRPERNVNPVEILIRTFDGCHETSGIIDMRAHSDDLLGLHWQSPNWHNACGLDDKFLNLMTELETKLATRSTRSRTDRFGDLMVEFRDELRAILDYSRRKEQRKSDDIAEILDIVKQLLEKHEKLETFFDQTIAPAINSLLSRT